jgi:hypothetical protein
MPQNFSNSVQFNAESLYCSPLRCGCGTLCAAGGVPHGCWAGPTHQHTASAALKQQQQQHTSCKLKLLQQVMGTHSNRKKA